MQKPKLIVRKIQESVISNRKFYMTLICLCFVLVGGMAAGFLTTFKPIFDTYCFTIVSLFAAFSGANIGSKFVQGKQKATIQITGTAQKVQPVEEIEEPTEE